jgi:hypothetical protein
MMRWAYGPRLEERRYIGRDMKRQFLSDKKGATTECHHRSRRGLDHGFQPHSLHKSSELGAEDRENIIMQAWTDIREEVFHII